MICGVVCGSWYVVCVFLQCGEHHTPHPTFCVACDQWCAMKGYLVCTVWYVTMWCEVCSARYVKCNI